MKDMYVKRGIFLSLMIVSFLAGCLFFVTNHLDFLVAAAGNNKFHISNIAYAIVRVISGVLLPAVFIAPTMFQYGQIRLTKILFIAYGILHLLTLSWILYFLGSNSIGDLFSVREIVLFQNNAKNAFVASYVFWDTYTWAGVLFTVIYSALCIYSGICFDDNRVRVRVCMILIVVARISFPLIYNLFANGKLWSTFWLANNYLDLLAVVAYSVAICLVSFDDETWVDTIWGHSLSSDDDENDIPVDNMGNI